MYTRKEAALSSQIEGTRATFSDLIKAEAGMADEVPNDVKEVENYVNATSYGFERLETLPLTLRLIREIHGILMEGVRGENKTPGEFRRSQNWIGGYSINTASYVPPSIDFLNGCLDNFENDSSVFRWKWTSDYETWVKFFLTGVIETAQEAVEIARSITALRNEDLKKINAMGRTGENALVIYEGLFGKPSISIEQAAARLNVSVTTSGQLLERLTEERILSNLDNRKRKKVFIYKRYIDAFNED